MGDYVALEAPAWLWILACFALLAAGIAFGALAAYTLQIARARSVAPDTRDTIPAPPPSIELPLDGDTSPGFAWHTRV